MTETEKSVNLPLIIHEIQDNLRRRHEIVSIIKDTEYEEKHMS